MNTFEMQISEYWEKVQKIYTPLQKKYGNRDY